MLLDVAPKARNGTKGKARRLRQEMSLPEILLWKELRKRPGGLKFRRQHPTGPFILDFFCSDARLAIEVDSEAHMRGDRPERDVQRDASLRAAGITTIRIATVEVLRDVEATVTAIACAARDRLPLHHPVLPDGPPPRD
ncbi:MAG: DUF559 domain-containing protein [Sphingobium sp.]|nr:DUF559 domain-containing protein [Sphingobium sp.]